MAGNGKAEDGDRTAATPSLGELGAAFLKIGFLSFGGAAAQIALMHRVIVEEKRWLDEPRYLHALNYCMLLPGPEAQQLATWVGWRLHGVRGGLLSGLLFIIPGAAIMMLLAALYVLGRDLPVVEGAFMGVKAAVIAIIVQALIRIGRRVLVGPPRIALMAAAFVALGLFDLPFPVVILAAGLIGAVAVEHISPRVPEDELPDPATGRRWPATLRTVLICAGVWWAPVLAAVLAFGGGHLLVEIGLFFSTLAVVSFGGAYALLAWLAQEAVAVQGWVSAAEMLDGLGLADTTPGPTILVTQFVGFLAGFRMPEPFGAMAGAAVAAAMALWVTFAPSFLWIFAGAPYLEDIRRHRRLAAAFAGIMAAVVGTIAWLALWFALHALFGEIGERTLGPLRWFAVDFATLDRVMAGLTILAFALVFQLRAGLFPTVGILAGLGVVVRLYAPGF